MKVPVPDDWNGEDWQCVQVEWPNSPQWTGLLTGILTLLTRGRYWDERTGSIRDTQAVAREIFDRNYPFNPCQGSDETEPPTQQPGGGGYSASESEEEMPAVTWLEIEDGILYMYFGPCCKIAVDGDFATVIDPPPDPPEDDEGDPPTWSCNKSAGMALRFWAAADSGISEMAAVDAAHRAQKLIETLPQFNITQEQAKVCALSYTADTTEGFALTTDPDTEAYIRCAWAAVLEETNGITAAEWAIMQSTLSSRFTTRQSALLVALMIAMRPTTFNWWAQAYAEVEANCDCPEADPYTGVVTFEDARVIHLESQGSSLDVATLNNPHVMHFEVKGGQNENFQEVHWDERLVASGTIQELQVEFPFDPSDVTVYYPAEDWNDANPTTLGNYLKPPTIGPGPDDVTYYPQPGKQVMVCTWAAPTDLDSASLDFGVKLNPKDQDPNVQTYKFRAEITYSGALR